MPETEEQPEETPEGSIVEAVELDLEVEDRKWLRAIIPILTMHADDIEHEYDGRVQRAWYEMKIAAFDRVKRIMGNDQLEDQS